jgi:hypothetical protein
MPTIWWLQRSFCRSGELSVVGASCRSVTPAPLRRPWPRQARSPEPSNRPDAIPLASIPRSLEPICTEELRDSSGAGLEMNATRQFSVFRAGKTVRGTVCRTRGLGHGRGGAGVLCGGFGSGLGDAVGAHGEGDAKGVVRPLPCSFAVKGMDAGGVPWQSFGFGGGMRAGCYVAVLGVGDCVDTGVFCGSFGRAKCEMWQFGEGKWECQERLWQFRGRGSGMQGGLDCNFAGAGAELPSGSFWGSGSSVPSVSCCSFWLAGWGVLHSSHFRAGGRGCGGCNVAVSGTGRTTPALRSPLFFIRSAATGRAAFCLLGYQIICVTPRAIASESLPLHPAPVYAADGAIC